MLEEKAMVKLLAKEMKKNHFRLILKRKKKHQVNQKALP